jgi:hypothetical protein
MAFEPSNLSRRAYFNSQAKEGRPLGAGADTSASYHFDGNNWSDERDAIHDEVIAKKSDTSVFLKLVTNSGATVWWALLPTSQGYHFVVINVVKSPVDSIIYNARPISKRVETGCMMSFHTGS